MKCPSCGKGARVLDHGLLFGRRKLIGCEHCDAVNEQTNYTFFGSRGAEWELLDISFTELSQKQSGSLPLEAK